MEDDLEAGDPRRRAIKEQREREVALHATVEPQLLPVLGY
jgi:hypothetical protein